MLHKDCTLARLWRTHSLAALLLATCLLVLLVVLSSPQRQSSQAIQDRVLRDMVGVDVSSLRRWLRSDRASHDPELVLR